MKIKRTTSLAFFILLLSASLFSKSYDIHIQGLENIKQEDILSVIRIKLEGLQTDEIEPVLEQVILNLGWFSEVEVRRENEDRLRIQVKEYPVVREMQIQGNTLLPEQEILDKLGLRIGQVFNRTLFYQNVQKLYAFYAERGYTQVEVAQVDIQPEGLLILSLTEWKVNDIIFFQDIRTRKKILLRFLIPGGEEIYNSLKIKKRIEELHYSEAFQAINITVDKSEEEGYLRLNAAIEETKPRFLVNLEYNTFGGFNGVLGISNKNFLGRLERFDLSDTFYHMDKSYSHRLRARWNPVLMRDKKLSLSLTQSANFWKNKSFNDPLFGEMDIFGWRGGLGLNKGWGADFSTGIGLNVDYWDLHQTDPLNSEEFSFSQGLFITPALHIDYQKEDRLKRQGFFSRLGLDLLLKENSRGTRWTFSARHYFTFAEDFRLQLDLEGGLLQSKNPPFLYSFWVGHREAIPYYRYEEMAFEKFGLLSAKIDLPILLHFMRFSPYVAVFTPFQESDILGSVRFVLGIELKLSVFGLPLYINWSFLDNAPVGSGRFSFYLK